MLLNLKGLIKLRLKNNAIVPRNKSITSQNDCRPKIKKYITHISYRNFVASVGNVMFKSMPGLADYVSKKSPPDKDHVISFEDFVRYVADHGLDKVDAHFKTVEQLCK